MFKDTSSSEDIDFSEYEQLNPNTIIKPLPTRRENVDKDVKRSPPPVKEKPRTPPKPMRRTTKSKSPSLDQAAMEAAESVSENAKDNKRMEKESKNVSNSGKKVWHFLIVIRIWHNMKTLRKCYGYQEIY